MQPKSFITLLSLLLVIYAPMVRAHENIIIAKEYVAGHVKESKKLNQETIAAAQKLANNPSDIATQKYGEKLGITPPVSVETASAGLLNNKGEVVGKAVFWQGTKGVVIKLYVEGLTAGAHGVHIHQKGKCETETAFTSAEGHVKHEMDKSHGFLHHEGPHIGDLPNIIAREDGTAHVEFYSESFRLNYAKQYENMIALLDEEGASIMIHASGDDYVSQPIGGSGARVACGVISQ